MVVPTATVGGTDRLSVDEEKAVFCAEKPHSPPPTATVATNENCKRVEEERLLPVENR